MESNLYILIHQLIGIRFIQDVNSNCPVLSDYFGLQNRNRNFTLINRLSEVFLAMEKQIQLQVTDKTDKIAETDNDRTN